MYIHIITGTYAHERTVEGLTHSFLSERKSIVITNATSTIQIGREKSDLPNKTSSRISPPEPVAAPGHGEMAVG